MKSVPLFKVLSSPVVEANVLDVLRSGQIAAGPFVENFERRLEAYLGVEHAVATSNMTSAIKLAFRICDVGAGDEILTTPFACLSTTSAISAVGAKPKWVDVEKNSVNIDIEDLESKISSNTRVLLLYHVAGYIGPLEQIVALCKKHNIVLIEDCNNALGSTFNGQKVGSFGDFAVFSFYPNRQINCGEGGSLICRRKKDNDRAIRLRRFGIDHSSFRDSSGEINPMSDVAEIGSSDTMSNLCAAMGVSQFDDLDYRIYLARKNKARLDLSLSNCSNITVLSPSEQSNSVFWVMLLWVKNRDALMSYLKSKDIGASKLHHRNDDYSGFGVERREQLENIKLLQEHVLAVPCGWWLSDEDLDYISEACNMWQRSLNSM